MSIRGKGEQVGGVDMPCSMEEGVVVCDLSGIDEFSGGEGVILSGDGGRNGRSGVDVLGFHQNRWGRGVWVGLCTHSWVVGSRKGWSFQSSVGGAEEHVSCVIDVSWTMRHGRDPFGDSISVVDVDGD